MPKQKMQSPPQIPQSEKKLERAICLLGSRTKVELSSKSVQELVALVGRYPNPQEAAVWKQFLKQMLKSKHQCYFDN
jgi:hypothetical protein